VWCRTEACVHCRQGCVIRSFGTFNTVKYALNTIRGIIQIRRITLPWLQDSNACAFLYVCSHVVQDSEAAHAGCGQQGSGTNADSGPDLRSDLRSAGSLDHAPFGDLGSIPAERMQQALARHAYCVAAGGVAKNGFAGRKGELHQQQQLTLQQLQHQLRHQREQQQQQQAPSLETPTNLRTSETLPPAFSAGSDGGALSAPSAYGAGNLFVNCFLRWVFLPMLGDCIN